MKDILLGALLGAGIGAVWAIVYIFTTGGF